MIIAVGGLLISGNTVLLGKRQADRLLYPETWDMPGGRVEEGETPEAALVRELQEETGVTPVRYRYLATLDDENDPVAFQYRIYAVFSWEGTPENLQIHEHSEIAWLTIGKAGNLKLPHSRYPALFKAAVAMAKQECDET